MKQKAECKISIYNEAWCQDLIKRLGRYREIQSNIVTIEVAIERSTSPSPKLISSYGDRLIAGAGSPVMDQAMEYELQEYKWEIRLLDAAISTLPPLLRAVAEKKFIDGASDWHITDIFLPRNFKNKRKQPLYISGRTLGYWKVQALKSMAKTLGYFKNCT